MRVALCDDDITQLNETRRQIESVYRSLDLLIYTFTDGRELIKSLGNVTYDLIILDIEMPEADGLTVAEKIREHGCKTALVFLTSHVEYAIKGYEVNALRYLTKPVKENQLKEIINHIIDENSSVKKLSVKYDDEIILLNVSDIFYLEAQNQNVRIVTGEKEYITRYNIKDYESELQNYYFMRCHRSYIVNLSHVFKVSGKEIHMRNNEVIPLSRTKEKALKDALMAYTVRSAI